ncbi:hypothetical protein BB561_006169 [Smittium simulii]|uniref:Ribosome assembly protein 3 n=1 Tax=Smittium simulii TaxID=133385 RepID=A0A2T9Y637_9FUNG|nr:hypothetical protein BB561_006169 [Smittium simulii]
MSQSNQLLSVASDSELSVSVNTDSDAYLSFESDSEPDLSFQPENVADLVQDSEQTPSSEPSTLIPPSVGEPKLCFAPDSEFQKVSQVSNDILLSKNVANVVANVVTTNAELIDKLNHSIPNSALKDGFKAMYMDALTASFGNELNQLRHMDQFDGSKLELLVTSLQAGVNVFEPTDLLSFSEN